MLFVLFYYRDALATKVDCQFLSHAFENCTSNLLKITFINNPDKNEEQVWARIEQIDPLGNTTPSVEQELFQFHTKVGERTFEDIVTYDMMLAWCNMDLDKDDFSRIEGNMGHQKEKDAGRGCVALVQWADGTASWNNLGKTFQDKLITVSLYAQRNGLQNTL